VSESGQKGNVSYKLVNGQADLFTFDPSAPLRAGHENHLTEIKRNGAVLESYVYDADGQRVKKTVGATSTYYYFPHYEVTGSTVTKYYFFAGQRIAMRVGNTLYYLHGDRVPPGRRSTSLATDSAGGVGNPVRDQGYYAYGRYRRGGTLPTDHKFTGQKLDGSGLYYYGARYYDPQIGLFLSADTLVPDPGVVFDYNRYMYVRGNPMRLVDPTGHEPCANGVNCDDPLRLLYQQTSAEYPWFAEQYTYAEFVEMALQYNQYATDPILYVQDLQVINGLLSGNVAAANGRLYNARTYAENALHESLGQIVSGSLAVAVLDDAQATGNGELIVGTALILAVTLGAFEDRANKTVEIVGKQGTYKLSFDSKGNPDFSPYALAEVKIQMKGNRTSDFVEADKAAGFKTRPTGYTWHHHQDGETMQLVPTDLHKRVFHYGGVHTVKKR
jgi:RHS repeat-associated protein